MPLSSRVLACTALLMAAPLAAQTATSPASSTKGFFVGAHLTGSALTADDLSDDTESGPGAGLHLSYGFTRQFALVLDASPAPPSTSMGRT